MPGLTEILAAIRTRARIIDPDTPVQDNLHAAEALASGDTTRPLYSDDEVRAEGMRQYANDRDFAELNLVVLRANLPPPPVTHATLWSFHAIAKALMEEREVNDWESLIWLENVRMELARRSLSPDELVRQLERTFRIYYRTGLNLLAFASHREFTRELNGLAVFTGPDLRPAAKAPLVIPSDDTITLAALSVGFARQLAELTDPLATEFIRLATLQIYALWGEAGYLAVKDRLTVERFVAQAQTARAE